jgi:hypothetical protein
MHCFLPISLERYIALHLKSNPGENGHRFRERLKAAVRAKQEGAVCECGNPIWAIGSAAAHYACFSCITGEAVPSSDYEIDVAI